MIPGKAADFVLRLRFVYLLPRGGGKERGFLENRATGTFGREPLRRSPFGKKRI